MAGKRRNRSGGGTGNKALVIDARIPPFLEFARNLPKTLNQLEIENMFSGRKPSTSEAKQILDRLLRCLQSQNPLTQRDAFVIFVILLSFNNHLKTDDVLNAMNEVLVTDGDNTRGERRVVYAARVMSLGAIVRSKRVGSMDVKILNSMLEQLVSLAEKRTSILILAAPIICELLSSLNSKQRKKKINLEPVQKLISDSSKQHIPSLFKITLTTYRLDFGLTSALMESMDTITDTLVGFVKYKDKECLSFLFQYLLSTKKTKEFWKLFASKIGSYHFDLLHACIVAAMGVGCALKHIVRPGVVIPLIGLLRNVEDKESLTKAKGIFRLLLDWDPKNSKTKMSSKDREKAIKLFFEEGQLSSDYFFLHQVFHRFITFLTSEELDMLYSICEPLSSIEVRGGNATINFLSLIPPLKSTSENTRFKIGVELFQSGFCCGDFNTLEISTDEKKKINPNIVAMRKKVCRNGFESILRSTYETAFIKELFKHVKNVSTGKVDGITLEKPASEEDEANLKTITKLLKKMKDNDLKNFLRIYGIYTVVNSSVATAGLDTLIPLCEKTLSVERTERVKELIDFIIAGIREIKVIFPYEEVFSRLSKEQVIGTESIQHMISIIDTEIVESEGEDDDEDEDDESEEDDSDLESKDSDDEFNESSGENGFNSSLTNGNGSIDGDGEPENSDEESIDMDEASETELENMDVALAHVFSTKKKVKESQKQEDLLTIRTLNLIHKFLRRYQTAQDGAIPLMLIMPCISLLMNSRKTKSKNQEIHSRVTKVIKSLNHIRKISGGEIYEETLLKNVTEDIEAILQKKLPKVVRNLIRGTMDMVQRCYKNQPQPHKKKGSNKRKSESMNPISIKSKKLRPE